MTTTIDETDDGTSAVPFSPDEPWIEALENQLTETMLDRVRRFARTRALGVARFGRKVDDYYARELVQDAVADTYTGARRWDPAAVSLETHLVRAVQCRTRDERRHLKKFRHQGLDDSTEDARDAERDLSLANGGDERAERQQYATEIMAAVRARAAGDRDVLRILDAYAAGVTIKTDVMAHAKMKARTYHNAHNRLVRVVRSLCAQTSNEHARA